MPAVETTLSWEIDGAPVPGPVEAEAFVNATPARRKEITRRIAAHIKTSLGPSATAKFQDAEEAVMMKLSAKMGAAAFSDAVDSLPPLEFDLEGHTVKVSFEDITSGGRRRKTAKKSRRKSRKVTRRRRV
jgi:hypothetical protein